MRWLVGSFDTERKLRILAFIALPLIALDALTKLAALALLEENGSELTLPGGAIGLTLLINETLVAAPTLQDLEASGVTGADMLFVIAAMLLGALIAIPFARASDSTPRRLGLAVLALIVPALVATQVGELLPLERFDVGFRALMPLRIACSTAVIVLLVRLVRHPLLVIGLATVLAGNLGNALNAIYEPRGVIDFLHVPMFGPYVFNVADVVIIAGVVLFVLGLAIAPFWRARLEVPPSASDRE